MGCSESKQCTVFLCWEGIAGASVLGKKIYGARSITTSGDYDVDLSSFSPPKRILGIGGFGMVRAVTKITGGDKNTVYALKSLSKSAVLQRSSGTAAVLSELKALALLVDAKFICNVHYAFQDTIFLYMIIDLAAGGDLRFALKFSPNCRFSEVRARFYVAQIILAVDSCHAASILHRDIKPENILLQANGYLLLSDFGVAKILQDVEDCRSTSGTHGYMAPEIYLPHHRHGTAADWFALGVTLHEFVTGRRPFETSKLQAFRNGEANAGLLSLVFLESCNYISESCKDFIAGLLVPKPSRRLGSYRGIEEMKQHSWLGGFDWEKLLTQSLPAPYKPDISFDRTDVKGENMRKAVYDHINSKSILSEEQYHFETYEYRRRYYTCGEYESSYHQTKPTMSINTSPAVSTGAGPVVAAPTLTRGRTPQQSQIPVSAAIQSPTSNLARSQGNGRQRVHCRQKVTYGDTVADNESRRTLPPSQMVWTLKSSLSNEERVNNPGGYNPEDCSRQQMQQQYHRTTVISHTGNPRASRDLSKFNGSESASPKSINKDRNWLQASKSEEEDKSMNDSKCSNVEVARESEKSAVPTGSTNTGSVSFSYMASQTCTPSLKSYIRSPQEIRTEAKESLITQSDEYGQQTNAAATAIPRTAPNSLLAESEMIGHHAMMFKSQKDKRQKLEFQANSEIVLAQPTSNIRPKSGRMDSLYRYQQQNLLRPPVINTTKIPVSAGKSSEYERENHRNNPNAFGLEPAIATASAGVRNFHGLNQVPNISDEEGNAADWIGHAMSSTSAPAEASLENSKTPNERSRKKEMGDNTSGSEGAQTDLKWGNGSLDSEETKSARGLNHITTEVMPQPHDSAVSYRDQVIISEKRGRNPSVQTTSLASRNQPNGIIKRSTLAPLSDWPVSDHKRPGSQRFSGRFEGIVARGDWNTDNSQDGDNASVSIVSPDATDNKELALPDSSI